MLGNATKHYAARHPAKKNRPTPAQGLLELPNGPAHAGAVWFEQQRVFEAGWQLFFAGLLGGSMVNIVNDNRFLD